MHCIYIYRKKENKQVVYVGQTCNISERRKQHEKDEPFNNLRVEYNYPLSRAIRKYGAEAFEFEILESGLSLEEANAREDYWIEYYNTIVNGYNQQRGGNNRTKLTDAQIEEIRDKIANTKMSYSEICAEYGCSGGFLTAINKGESYHSSKYSYPLRATKNGKHFSDEVLTTIIEKLKDKTLTLAQIAKEYGVSQNVIVRINQGESYYNKNLIYPIRAGRASRKKG